MGHMSWLEVVRQDLEQIEESDLIEPPMEAEEDEEVLGEASPYLRRLWTLAAMMQKKAKLAELEIIYNSSHASQKELRAQASELAHKAEILRNVFWSETKDELNSWDRPAIGIRRDWVVVACNEDDLIPDIIKRIIGG